jgi:hypothetical protein
MLACAAAWRGRSCHGSQVDSTCSCPRRQQAAGVTMSASASCASCAGPAFFGMTHLTNGNICGLPQVVHTTMAAVESASQEQQPLRWLLALQAILLEFEAAKLPWSAVTNPSSAFGSSLPRSALAVHCEAMSLVLSSARQQQQRLFPRVDDTAFIQYSRPHNRSAIAECWTCCPHMQTPPNGNSAVSRPFMPSSGWLSLLAEAPSPHFPRKRPTCLSPNGQQGGTPESGPRHPVSGWP